MKTLVIAAVAAAIAMPAMARGTLDAYLADGFTLSQPAYDPETGIATTPGWSDELFGVQLDNGYVAPAGSVFKQTKDFPAAGEPFGGGTGGMPVLLDKEDWAPAAPATGSRG